MTIATINPSTNKTNLFIPTEFVETILSDDRVQGVSLTGSEPAGAAVAEIAGKHLERSVLELGGNDAFILTDITSDMPTFDQEIFGPVATVYVVKDEAEAIKLANNSSYGLGGDSRVIRNVVAELLNRLTRE